MPACPKCDSENVVKKRLHSQGKTEIFLHKECRRQFVQNPSNKLPSRKWRSIQPLRNNSLLYEWDENRRKRNVASRGR